MPWHVILKVCYGPCLGPLAHTLPILHLAALFILHHPAQSLLGYGVPFNLQIPQLPVRASILLVSHCIVLDIAPEVRCIWVQIPILLLPGCEILGNSLSEAQFPHMSNGDYNF